MSTAWEFGNDPFPAYRVSLEFGRNKRDRGFFPVAGVAPVANALKENQMVLPEGQFRVIKTQAKGTILVIHGSDDTNRCLLFVGDRGGFRGGVSIAIDGTTATVLKECSAANNLHSAIEAVALLEAGQTIAFHAWGRSHNQVTQYTWDGEKIITTFYSGEEWKARNVVMAPPSDAEVL